VAWWITIYCTKSVSTITGAQLLDGIQDRDQAAPAGVEYHTLAVDDDVDDSQVSPALASLRVEPQGKLPIEQAVHYSDDGRMVLMQCWNQAARVAEELEECRDVRDPPPAAEDTLARCTEIVALELGASQFGTMGVVIAYEIARYLAQKGSGIFVDDEDEWFAVRDGAFGKP
jgi:hypothetical protein